MKINEKKIAWKENEYGLHCEQKRKFHSVHKQQNFQEKDKKNIIPIRLNSIERPTIRVRAIATMNTSLVYKQ